MPKPTAASERKEIINKVVFDLEFQVLLNIYTVIHRAEIFKQYLGARNRVNMVAEPAHQTTQHCGIGFLESILGLLKSLKIRAQICEEGGREENASETHILLKKKKKRKIFYLSVLLYPLHPSTNTGEGEWQVAFCLCSWVA
jgi:hypothetical protein